MYDPSGNLHDEQGEPKYTEADKVDDHAKEDDKLFRYYLYRGPVEALPLKIDHIKADAEHVDVYLRVKDSD